jgi:hypothetical protein
MVKYPPSFAHSVIKPAYHFIAFKNLQLPRNLGSYCAEISYAFRFAEQAVPLQRVRKGINPEWLTKPDLITPYSQAKLWFSVWKYCGPPSLSTV